jgi:hypothetical protein
MKINLVDYTPKTEEISIPQWSADPLYVQELLGTQLEMIQRYAHLENGKAVIEHQNALLIITSLIDKEGNYLFTEKDIENLEKQPATIIAKILESVNRVSGVTV